MSATSYLDKAIAVLRKATTDKGILALASDEITENYTRVWARDSIMAGYAGILCDDTVVKRGMKASLYTLMRNQSAIGVIPSNVSVGEERAVSYGGTAGRVDATLWYIIGVLLYYKDSEDEHFLREHRTALIKAIDTTIYWEYNHKHLLYTPLSGNWADEYPLHGYTLYDNCLRLWGLELFAEVIDMSYKTKAQKVRAAIKENFFLSESPGSNSVAKEVGSKVKKRYHGNLYDRALQQYGDRPYAMAGFNPSQYYDIFDCGGNGLALMLGLYEVEQLPRLTNYLRGIWAILSVELTPAFWPVIKDGDPLWSDIEMNYAYEFKNKPHHFHNGGIWPIMMGWLGLGLRSQGNNDLVEQMLAAYLQVCEIEDYQFSEYISSDELQPQGKAPLCYSAAGLIFLDFKV